MTNWKQGSTTSTLNLGSQSISYQTGFSGPYDSQNSDFHLVTWTKTKATPPYEWTASSAGATNGYVLKCQDSVSHPLYSGEPRFYRDGGAFEPTVVPLFARDNSCGCMTPPEFWSLTNTPFTSSAYYIGPEKCVQKDKSAGSTGCDCDVTKLPWLLTRFRINGGPWAESWTIPAATPALVIRGDLNQAAWTGQPVGNGSLTYSCGTAGVYVNGSGKIYIYASVDTIYRFGFTWSGGTYVYACRTADGCTLDDWSSVDSCANGLIYSRSLTVPHNIPIGANLPFSFPPTVSMDAEIYRGCPF